MIKLKTFLAAMTISFTAQAVQSLPVEQLIDTGMLKEGTRIGLRNPLVAETRR
jgi:hypothetical protein